MDKLKVPKAKQKKKKEAKWERRDVGNYKGNIDWGMNFRGKRKPSIF